MFHRGHNIPKDKMLEGTEILWVSVSRPSTFPIQSTGFSFCFTFNLKNGLEYVEICHFSQKWEIWSQFSYFSPQDKRMSIKFDAESYILRFKTTLKFTLWCSWLGSNVENITKSAKKTRKYEKMAINCPIPRVPRWLGEAYITTILGVECDSACKNTLRRVGWGPMLQICENGQNPENAKNCYSWPICRAWCVVKCI